VVSTSSTDDEPPVEEARSPFPVVEEGVLRPSRNPVTVPGACGLDKLDRRRTAG